MKHEILVEIRAVLLHCETSLLQIAIRLVLSDISGLTRIGKTLDTNSTKYRTTRSV